MYLTMYISNKVPVKPTATYIPIHPCIYLKDEEIFPSMLIMKTYDTHTDPNLINKPIDSLKQYTLIYSPIKQNQTTKRHAKMT